MKTQKKDKVPQSSNSLIKAFANVLLIHLPQANSYFRIHKEQWIEFPKLQDSLQAYRTGGCHTHM